MSERITTTAFGVAREEWPQLVETWKERLPEDFEDDFLPEVKDRGCAMDLDPTLLFLDVLYIRKLLSVVNNPPIDTIFDTGCCEALIKIAHSSADNKLVFEALWAVTNLASGTSEHTVKVVQRDVFEQATWGLGNICGDSAELRDLVLATEISAVACDRFQAAIKTGSVSLQRNFTWMVSNMVRSKPPPPLEVIRPLIPMLHCALNEHDEEVRLDAAWAFAYISDGPQDRGAWLLSQCPNLVTMLSQALASDSTQLIKPCIRIIENLLTGTNSQTQMLLDQGVLDTFPDLLHHAKDGIRREACWCLSSIAEGAPEQMRFLLDPSILLPLQRCCHDNSAEVMKEAFLTLANAAASVGGETAADAFVQYGIMQSLLHGLVEDDLKIVSTALEALRDIFTSTPKTNGRWPMVEHLVWEGLDVAFIYALECLVSDHSGSVADEAKELLDTFFKIDDNE